MVDLDLNPVFLQAPLFQTLAALISCAALQSSYSVLQFSCSALRSLPSPLLALLHHLVLPLQSMDQYSDLDCERLLESFVSVFM